HDSCPRRHALRCERVLQVQFAAVEEQAQVGGVAFELEVLQCLPVHSLRSLRNRTVGSLIRWWLATYVAGKGWAGREENRFRRYFETTELARLPVVALTAGRLELFLQHWSQQGLAPASINKLRAIVRTTFNRARHAGLVHGQ